MALICLMLSGTAGAEVRKEGEKEKEQEIKSHTDM